MTGAWDLLIARDDLTNAVVRESSVPDVGPGEALLRVDRVGMTANNVTYARMGEAMRYWDFFPANEGWGRVPLWGFAEVEASNVDDVAVGTRVYGFLPSSSHLVIRPSLSAGGIADASEHRAELPRAYNVYVDTSVDPGYREEYEDLQILYRPLFITSFMLDDYLIDADLFGAEVVLFSSASSKTSYGTAFLMSLREQRPRLIGLTSSGNVAFTESLGCYDEVVPYDEVTRLDGSVPALYVDVSGNPKLRANIHQHFEKLVHDAAVGIADDEATFGGTEDLPGPPPKFFFAPDQIRKRRADWGPGGIEERYGAAWARFAPTVANWVDVKVGEGRDDLVAVWLEVLGGRVDPRVGHVVSLASATKVAG